MRATAEYGKPKITGYTVEISSDEAFQLVKFFGALSRNDIRKAVPGYSEESVEALYRVTSRFYVEVYEAGRNAVP